MSPPRGALADKHVDRFTPAFVVRMLENHHADCDALHALPVVSRPRQDLASARSVGLERRRSRAAQVRAVRHGLSEREVPGGDRRQDDWGTPQTFTFVGGEPFVIFGYAQRAAEHQRVHPCAQGRLRHQGRCRN
jgi:hypothetical protein